MNNLAQEGQVVKKNYQRRLPSSPAKDYYAIIRETPNTEALIIEYGNVNNANDANRLKNNYKNYAEAVIRAILEQKNLKYTPPKGSSEYYVVQSGDTLWTISRKYGITVNELKNLNNLSSNTLTIGQTLKLSSASSSDNKPNTSTYLVKSGDSLWTIARKYGITVDALKKLNNLSTDNLAVNQQILVPGSSNDSSESNLNKTEYTVKPGDSLWKIAQKFDTTVSQIKSANNLTDNVLTIGQTLTIPTMQSYKTYTVVRGDTLYFIALNNNTTVDKLKVLNNLSSNNLMIGQKLLIPNN